MGRQSKSEGEAGSPMWWSEHTLSDRKGSQAVNSNSWPRKQNSDWPVFLIFTCCCDAGPVRDGYLGHSWTGPWVGDLPVWVREPPNHQYIRTQNISRRPCSDDISKHFNWWCWAYSGALLDMRQIREGRSLSFSDLPVISWRSIAIHNKKGWNQELRRVCLPLVFPLCYHSRYSI